MTRQAPNTQPGSRNLESRPSNGDRDFLWPHVAALPAFRALLRAVEARLYQEFLPLSEPVLDLGCGDGHFASLAFPRSLAAGIDPSSGALHEAQHTGAYGFLAQAEGGALPFLDGHFATVISNSVLEHIPDVDPVLAETARVLKSGGRFIFCVPSEYFTRLLLFPSLFRRLRLEAVARGYERYFNRISRHYHCDGPEVWQARLANAGLRVDRHFYYFSERAHRVLDVGHYIGAPNLIVRKLYGRWVLFPSSRNPILALTERWLRPHYRETLPRSGAYHFFVSHKLPLPNSSPL